MTATLDAAPLPLADGAPSPRRRPDRRDRRKGVGLAVVVAAGVLLAGGAVAAPGAAGVDRAGPARVSGGVPVVELAGYGERGAQVVGYEHGASWRLEVPVRNDSPVPLVVVGAQWASVARPLLAIGASERLALGPGESGTLRVSGTATDCRYYHERELAVLDRLRLDLEVLGRTASRQLRLDRPLLVHSPMIVGCPDRVLDRRAVNKP